MNMLIALAVAILAALAITLPNHHHQWYQPPTAAPSHAYSYGVVECGHNDLCLGA